MKIIVILGPTASGKTKLGIKLAKKFSGEIINADSRVIYKGFNIGTDKPQGQWLKVNGKKVFVVQGIPHHLIDFLTPKKVFSVAEYQRLAFKKLKEIQKKGKIPFLVGGSPLYINSVVYNYQIPKVEPDFQLRKKLEKEPLEKLVKKLKKLNSEVENMVDIKNKRRIIRALEILLRGKKLEKISFSKPSLDTLILGIKINREELYEKINKRVDLMIKKGLVEEVRKLFKKYGKDAPAFSGIGYNEIIRYLNGEVSLFQAIELIKRNSRRFAKRQLTWFRADKNIKWISSFKEACESVDKFLRC